MSFIDLRFPLDSGSDSRRILSGIHGGSQIRALPGDTAEDNGKAKYEHACWPWVECPAKWDDVPDVAQHPCRFQALYPNNELLAVKECDLVAGYKMLQASDKTLPQVTRKTADELLDFWCG